MSEYGTDFLNRLSGIFAFVLYDKRTNDFSLPGIRSVSCPSTPAATSTETCMSPRR